jgi:hypothetical protein
MKLDGSGPILARCIRWRGGSPVRRKRREIGTHKQNCLRVRRIGS